MDRRGEPDRHDPDTFHLGKGESYRPGGDRRSDAPRPFNRDRPTADNWSSERRDDRREPRREEIDSYIPPTSSRVSRPRSRSPAAFRRRSRSPRRDDTFSARARTPPHRYSPRRDERPRSPPRRRSKSPYGRPRSPYDAQRRRDYTPEVRRERLPSPGRSRYERPRSPVRRQYSPPRDTDRGYRPRSRTPPRRDDSWRRRSPSPKGPGPASTTTSRRSSPPVHPDRLTSVPRSPYSQPRSQYDSRRSPVQRQPSPPRARSPPRGHSERFEGNSPYSRNGDVPAAQPPSGPSGYRNATDRVPPSGPSRGHSQSHMSPPVGPSSATSSTVHNRSTGPAVLTAPTRPRGAAPGRFDAPREFSGSPAPRGRGASLTYRGAAPRSATYQHSEPPTYGGPRGGGYGRGDYGGRGDFSYGRQSSFSRGGGESSFPFRSNNSSSTTYPRTQRFNTTQQHLQTKEKIVPGGQLLPSGLPPEQEKRIKMLEDEAEKMRQDIEDKQKTKREALREWEVRERESDRDKLRSDLAEQHLNKLSQGEDGIGAAF